MDGVYERGDNLRCKNSRGRHRPETQNYNRRRSMYTIIISLVLSF